ncbi:unnamed protein product [Linum trigynum]|uniref:Uncharacterized protein n=1 Tax=Linum trigynum TaxID=586398 RepID=A0AAV2GTA0_9ROSI
MGFEDIDGLGQQQFGSGRRRGGRKLRPRPQRWRRSNPFPSRACFKPRLVGSWSRIPLEPDHPIIYVNTVFEKITWYRVEEVRCSAATGCDIVFGCWPIYTSDLKQFTLHGSCFRFHPSVALRPSSVPNQRVIVP